MDGSLKMLSDPLNREPIYCTSTGLVLSAAWLNTTCFLLIGLGPKGLAFQYVGQLLSNSNNFNIGIGLTISTGATLSVLVDNTTIGFNINNELTVIGGGAQPYYQYNSPTASIGDYSPTGITISYTPNNYSRVQVFINGQLQRLGDGTSSSVDCYFTPDGIIARTFSSILTGDELYWNGTYSGFDLSTRDKVDIVYEY